MWKMVVHNKPEGCAAEIRSKRIEFKTVQDILDLMANMDDHIRKVILHEHNFHPDFFNLKTGLAGDILQKFVNYSMQLAIVGDFSKYTSQSLQDFIRESNQGNHVFFCDSLESAFYQLAG